MKDPISATPLNNKIGISAVWLERFISKIDRDGPGGCWVWKAFINSAGYGQFKVGGQGTPPWRAHRLSYFLTYGPIQDGLYLHHACNRRECVNPAHLVPVTPREHAVNINVGSGSYIAARKAHCKNGHEFTPENTRYTNLGKRVCIQCNRAWHNKKHHDFRAANPLPEKTHCIHGHPLSGDNLYLYKTKTGVGRGCNICRRAVVDAYQRNNREKVLARRRELRRLRKSSTK